MTDTAVNEWEKELKVLLGLIEANPSKDLTRERERVVVLSKLIAEHGGKHDA